MDLFSKLYHSVFSKSKLAEEVKEESFSDSSFFFIVLLLVQIIILSLTRLDDIPINIGLSEFLNNLIKSTVLMAGYAIGIVIISYLLNFFLRIYNDKTTVKDTIKSIIYGLIPVYILSLILMLGGWNFIINSKPVIILLFGIWTAYLTYNLITKITGTTKGYVIPAIVLFILFCYIIYLGKIDVIIFYSVMMGVLFWNRKKFTAENIVLMYKTKLGLKNMNSMARRFPRALRYLGDAGIITGFAGMLTISIMLLVNAVKLLTIPNTMPGAAPILPGIPIPGSPITLPLWYGIISIFVVVFIHEFSHGVIARLHKIRVKSSGFLFVGPIIGAFVEPDEKRMEKKKARKQLAVLGAGPFSNILLAGLVLLIINLLLAPAIGSMMDTDGVSVDVLEDTPAAKAGLKTNMVVKSMNGTPVKNTTFAYDFLNSTDPGEKVELETKNRTFTVTLTEHPETGSGYLGIKASPNRVVKESYKQEYGTFIPDALLILNKFFFWLFVISFGIGLANLLPLGPVDGGRMLQISLRKYFKKAKADMIWQKVSAFFILLLMFIILFPLFQWIGAQL